MKKEKVNFGLEWPVMSEGCNDSESEAIWDRRYEVFKSVTRKFGGSPYSVMVKIDAPDGTPVRWKVGQT